MKKIFKYTFITIIGLIIALFVASFVFKDKILIEFKKQLSSRFNATIDFKDFDVSFLKSFPEIQLTLKDASVIGVDTFDQIPLFKAQTVKIDFNILPYVRNIGEPSLKYIGVDHGTLNLIKLADGNANYLITKETNDTTKLKMTLEKFELTNTDVYYEDHALNMNMQLMNTDHTGKGDIENDNFDFETKTQADSFKVVYDDFTYINNVKAKLDALININLPEEIYTLKDNIIELNNLKLKGNGVFQFKGDDLHIKADLRNDGDQFKNILSVLPYIDHTKEVKADGKLTFLANADGVYNSMKATYPSFDVKLKVENGSAQYAGLDYPIKDIHVDMGIVSKSPTLKNVVVDIKKFHAQVNSEAIDGNLLINDGLRDPRVVGKILASITLENWAKALPLSKIESIKGKVISNLTFDALKSDIDKSNYSAIKFDGNFDTDNLQLKAMDMPLVLVKKGSLAASPQKLALNTSGMQLGKSVLNMSGSLENPLAYFSTEKNIKGNINVDANIIDANEWLSNSKENNTQRVATNDLSPYKFSEVDVNFKANEIVYENYKIANVKAEGKLGLQNMDISQMSANIGDSDITLSGRLANVYDFFFGDKVLIGDIKMLSNKFNANQFMAESQSKNTMDSLLFEVPANVNVNVETQINQLQYTNLNLSNVNGKVEVNNRAILLKDYSGEVLGGKVNITGLYDSKEAVPNFNVKFGLEKIQFPKAFEQFLTIKQLAPVMKYIEGVFNTTLVMEGKMGKGMLPDVTTLTASGLIETLNGAIKGFAPLKAAKEKLGVDEVGTLNLKDTKNWFDIKNGVVEIKEFSKQIGDLGLKMKGSHKIKGPMNYEMFVKLPRKLLKGNKITGQIESGWSFIEKEAAKKGLNLEQGEFIDLKILLSGMLNSPDVKISLIGTSGKSLQEELKEEASKKLEETRDSIKKVVVKKTEEIKDSLRKAAEKELENNKNKAEDKANEIVKQVKDEVKKEVEKKLDSIVGKAVSDSLKNKAGEILKEKDVDQIKDKLKDWNPFKKKKG